MGMDLMIDKKKQNARQDAWTKEHKDLIQIKVPVGTKAIWQSKATNDNLSLTQWIIKKCSD